MRNRSLHGALLAFGRDAALHLAADTAAGAEVPFEVVEEAGGGRRTPLYCYRPLTAQFIRARIGRLGALETYAPAVRGLEGLDGLERYLEARGESVRRTASRRERADAALSALLGDAFGESTEFELISARFDRAYADLEAVLYADRISTTVIAPLFGLRPDSAEVALGDGLSLVQGETLSDAPLGAVWGLASERVVPATLVLLERAGRAGASPPLAAARTQLRRLLTALRLFEPDGVALGAVAWTRTDGGPWGLATLGSGAGGARHEDARLTAAQEDELRAFVNLITRHPPPTPELAWALRRFELAGERAEPLEALSDHLLALRALLEPEGPSSGRLAERVAVLCGQPAERAALSGRVAHAAALERAYIAGRSPAEPEAEALVTEVADHARALLSDVLCGHLDADLCAIADEELAAPAPAG